MPINLIGKKNNIDVVNEFLKSNDGVGFGLIELANKTGLTRAQIVTLINKKLISYVVLNGKKIYCNEKTKKLFEKGDK